MATTTLQQYEQPIWGRLDRALRNCAIGASIVGVAVLILVFVVPAPPPKPLTMEELPDRIARLILEKPKPMAPPIKAPEIAARETPKTEPEAKPKTPPAPRRRTSPPKVAPNRGTQGREMAKKEVSENLAQVTGSLDKVLDNVSQALPTSKAAPDDDRAVSRRRRSRVRGGRTTQQLSSVGGVSSLSAPDVSGSAIESEGISISAISDVTTSAGGGSPDAPQSSGGSGGNASSANPYRSNESLLGVVRRYAPGIQFCYDNELKKHPDLRGKLVVSLTVLANGSVSDVSVVEDKLGSPAVTRCVVSQIRGWHFPEIAAGTTTFKTPFVFTPPN